MTADTQTLGDALPAKIREINEVIIPAYEEVIKFAPMTALTVALMRHEVNEAVEALASGDLVRMIHAYANIKDYEL